MNLQITGMTCASCVSRVEKTLRALPGIATATVNLATETVTLTAATPIDLASVIAAVKKSGYGVTEQNIVLAITGMTCASCVGRVEQALSNLSGVLKATVNLATEHATVQIASGAVTTEALIDAVRRAGYQATATGASDKPRLLAILHCQSSSPRC